MKKLILISIFFLPVLCKAQRASEYKATNGIFYHKGDTIRMSSGSDPKGNFQALIRNSWYRTGNEDVDAGPYQFDVDKKYHDAIMVIYKIKERAVLSERQVIFTVIAPDQHRFDLLIDKAIEHCEIADCQKVDRSH